MEACDGRKALPSHLATGIAPRAASVTFFHTTVGALTVGTLGRILIRLSSQIFLPLALYAAFFLLVLSRTGRPAMWTEDRALRPSASVPCSRSLLRVKGSTRVARRHIAFRSWYTLLRRDIHRRRCKRAVKGEVCTFDGTLLSRVGADAFAGGDRHPLSSYP